MRWKDAVLEALRRYSLRHNTIRISRQGLIREELELIERDRHPRRHICTNLEQRTPRTAGRGGLGFLGGRGLCSA